MPRVIILLSLLASFVLFSCGGPRFAGVEEKAEPALDFQLTSHTGNNVKLSDFQGRVVLLTFLYANCVEFCPLITANLKLAAEKLPPQEVGQVAFLGVSVDPERDTVEAMAKYCQDKWVPPDFLFLTGSREGLQGVWKSYGVFVHRALPTPAPVEGSHHGHEGYVVEHSLKVVLIDKDGMKRASYLGADIRPEDVAKDIRTLLALKR